MPVSRSDRSQLARIAALELHAQRDSRELLKPAQAASPGQLPYWEKHVDPEGMLAPLERRRRAELKRRAYFQRLALKSARARRGRRTSPQVAA